MTEDRTPEQIRELLSVEFLTAGSGEQATYVATGSQSQTEDEIPGAVRDSYPRGSQTKKTIEQRKEELRFERTKESNINSDIVKKWNDLSLSGRASLGWNVKTQKDHSGKTDIELQFEKAETIDQWKTKVRTQREKVKLHEEKLARITQIWNEEQAQNSSCP